MNGFSKISPTDFPVTCITGYRFSFNGMEKDDEIKGLGNSLDFGARIYDSRLGRWLSPDPYFMKYVSISPFAYVNNNPILFIDPNGKEIFIKDPETGKPVLYVPNETSVQNGLNPFITNAAKALDHLTNSGADVNGIILSFSSDQKNDILIEESNRKSTFKVNPDAKLNPEERQSVGTIKWSSKHGLKFKNKDGTKGRISAAIALMHEMGHGESVRTDGIFSFFLRNKTYSDQDGNLEEEYVRTQFENPAADKLEEGIRDSHTGRYFKSGSFSSLFTKREQKKESKAQDKTKSTSDK